MNAIYLKYITNNINDAQKINPVIALRFTAGLYPKNMPNYKKFYYIVSQIVQIVTSGFIAILRKNPG